MIVAARAGDGETEQAAADDVNAVIIDEEAVVDEALADVVEAEGGELRRIEVHFVRGELTHDELIVRHVVVERFHDPVAVGVGVGVKIRAAGDLVAIRIGVADDIEPDAGPFFAVGGLCEQLIDEIGRFRLIDLFFGRRQAGEREVNAADKCARICGWREVEACGLQFGLHELVERLGAVRLHGLEGPVLHGIGFFAVGGGFGLGGPRDTEGDPFFERGDLRIRELAALFGHGFDASRVFHGFDELAGGGIAGLDDLAVVTAAQNGGAGVEAEAVLVFVSAVALVAALSEHRADLLFKELDLVRRKGVLRGDGEAAPAQGEDEKTMEHGGKGVRHGGGDLAA